MSPSSATAAVALLGALLIGGAGGYSAGAAQRPAAATVAATTPLTRIVDPTTSSTMSAGQAFADEGEYCRYGPAMECLSRGRAAYRTSMIQNTP
jgi:hypothetical protein